MPVALIAVVAVGLACAQETKAKDQAPLTLEKAADGLDALGRSIRGRLTDVADCDRDCLLGHPYPTAAGFPRRAQEIEDIVARLKLGASQQAVLDDVVSLSVSPVDLWQGSHVVVAGDRGALYAKWEALDASPRVSSHYPGVDVQQYELRFGHHALLFGKTGWGDTWFQMENHSGAGLGDPRDIPGHVDDFLKYQLAQQNVGPLGLSPHRESDAPLRVSYRPRP